MKLIKSLIVLSLAGAVAACTPQPKVRSEQLAQCNQYLSNDNSHAVACFTDLYKADPKSPAVLLGLAQSFVLVNKVNELTGVGSFENINQMANSALATPGLSNSLQARAYAVKAAYWYYFLASKDNVDPGYQASIQNLQSAMSLDPTYIGAYDRLAEIYLYQNKTGLEAAVIQAAIGEAHLEDNSTDLARAYVMDAKYWQQLQDAPKALLASQKAIKADPKNVSAYFLHAWASAQENKPDDVKADFKQAESMIPTKDDSFYNARGQANLTLGLFNKDYYQDAIRDFTEQVDLSPQVIWIRGWRAKAYVALGNYQAALTDCEAMLKADPEDVGAKSLEMWAYYNLGDYDKALSSLKTTSESDYSQIVYGGRLMIYSALAEKSTGLQKEQYEKLAQENLTKAIEADNTNDNKEKNKFLAQYKCFNLNEKSACPVALKFYQENPQAFLPNNKEEMVKKLEALINTK